MNDHIGSSFESFLNEEGIKDIVYQQSEMKVLYLPVRVIRCDTCKGRQLVEIIPANNQWSSASISVYTGSLLRKEDINE